MPIRVVSIMSSLGISGASSMYIGGAVRFALFCSFDMAIAMHSLLGPFVRLVHFIFWPRRFTMISCPAIGSRALTRTASGFSEMLPAVILKQ